MSTRIAGVNIPDKQVKYALTAIYGLGLSLSGKICGSLNIDPTKRIDCKSNIIKTNSDHRIAMAFAIMGTNLGINLKIQNAEYINTSFPRFSKEMNSVGGNISE